MNSRMKELLRILLILLGIIICFLFLWGVLVDIAHSATLTLIKSDTVMVMPIDTVDIYYQNGVSHGLLTDSLGRPIPPPHIYYYDTTFKVIETWVRCDSIPIDTYLQWTGDSLVRRYTYCDTLLAIREERRGR